MKVLKILLLISFLAFFACRKEVSLTFKVFNEIPDTTIYLTYKNYLYVRDTVQLLPLHNKTIEVIYIGGNWGKKSARRYDAINDSVFDHISDVKVMLDTNTVSPIDFNDKREWLFYTTNRSYTQGVYELHVDTSAF